LNGSEIPTGLLLLRKRKNKNFKKKIAVINGLEYLIGEEIEPGGFIAREIYPDRVVIEMKGQKQKIIVPLVEY
jgi:type II secretory pathway component PulC